MLGSLLNPEANAMPRRRKLLSALVLLSLTLLALPAPVQAQPYDYRHPRRHRYYRPPPPRYHHHHRYYRRPYVPR